MNPVYSSIVAGLVGAFGLGISNYLAIQHSRERGAVVTNMVRLALSLPILFGIAIFSGKLDIPISAIPINALIGGLFALALISFYRALAIGPASITNPIANTDGLLVVLFAVLLGERLKGLQLLAIIVIIGCSVAATVDLRKFRLKIANIQGLYFAILAATLFGFAFALAGHQARRLGWVTFLLWDYIFQLLFAGLVFLKLTPINKRFKNLHINKRIVLFVVINFVGSSAVSIGLQYGLASLVVPISSASPLVAIVLALLHLKEKVTRSQAIASVLICLGLIALTL